MKKKKWFSKITVVMLFVQLLIAMIFDRKFFCISLAISVTIAIISTLLVNAKFVDAREESITYNAFKLVCGMFALLAIAAIRHFRDVDINLYSAFLSYYILPIVSIFVIPFYLKVSEKVKQKIFVKKR